MEKSNLFKNKNPTYAIVYQDLKYILFIFLVSIKYAIP